MNLSQTIERLQVLHSLISQRKTGTPEQLAKRLGVSRSCLYNLIEELRVFQIPILYSRKIESFYYEKEVKFDLNLEIRIMNNEDLININGGNLTFFVPSNFLDGTKLSLSPYLRKYKESATGFKLWQK